MYNSAAPVRSTGEATGQQQQACSRAPPRFIGWPAAGRRHAPHATTPSVHAAAHNTTSTTREAQGRSMRAAMAPIVVYNAGRQPQRQPRCSTGETAGEQQQLAGIRSCLARTCTMHAVVGTQTSNDQHATSMRTRCEHCACRRKCVQHVSRPHARKPQGALTHPHPGAHRRPGAAALLKGETHAHARHTTAPWQPHCHHNGGQTDTHETCMHARMQQPVWHPRLILRHALRVMLSA